ncbi:MAG: glycoside hydrolase [Mesorhizobium sp.]|nr:MAG: glycoside hydrolase [Mesorhizobium sp.]
MVGKVRSLASLLLFTCFMGLAPSVAAADDLIVLTDDASRSTLFQRIVEAKEKEPPMQGEPFALSGQFTFPQHAAFDDELPRKDSYFGIDISHHNDPSINFRDFKQQKILFVYAKATQGTKFKDGKFADYYAALDALPDNKRLLRGPYHFLTAEGDGVAQADTFVDFVTANGGFGEWDLPPVMDLEWDVTKNNPDRWQNKSPEYIVEKALKFLNRVEERTGRVPMLYTAVTWWKERNIPLSEFKRFAGYRLWIADYSKSSRAVELPKVFPDYDWHLWQFTASARITSGYPKGLDANIFKGTPEQFEQFFGVALP